MKDPINNVRPTSIRFPQIIRKMAEQNIIAHAIKNNIKAENFTEYLKRLIMEDYLANKNSLKPSEKEKISKIIKEES